MSHLPHRFYLQVIVALLASWLQANAQIKQYSIPCEMHVVRGQNAAPIEFGGQTLELRHKSDQEIFESLRREVRLSKSTNLVVYSFVDAVDGVTSVRIEKDSSGKTLESIVSRSGLTEDQFRSSLVASGQTLADAERQRLRKAFMPSDSSTDNGKTVMFFDLAFYGILPARVGERTGLLLGSQRVDPAVENAKRLSELHIKPSDFTVYLGYPETEADRAAVFGEAPSASLSEWQQRSREMREMSKRFGFTVLGAPEMKSMGGKEAVLRSIEASKAIVWVVAHSGGCSISFSNGQTIHISPSDIRNLKLKNSPLVIVRVCDAGDDRFAEAFLAAGAGAVWVNRGTVQAASVNDELSQAMEEFGKDADFKTVLDRMASAPVKHSNSLGVSVELRTDLPIEIVRQEDPLGKF